MKIFKILMIAAMILGFMPAVHAEGEFQYISADSQLIDAQSVANGTEISAFNGEFKIQVPVKALKTAGRIEMMSLELSADSSMHLPDGYKAVSGIYEYQLRGTGFNKKFPLQLTVPYQSTLEFDKFLLVYDEKKMNWKEAVSLTDLKQGIVTASLPFSQLKFVVVDTDAMTDGHASWYRYKKCMCAASPDFPKGTKLLVTNKNKNLSIVVKVNDWGPERDLFPNRVIDLDLVAFSKLASKGTGVMTSVHVVPFVADKFDPAVSKKLLAGEAVELTSEPAIVAVAPEKISSPVVEKAAAPAVEVIVAPVVVKTFTPAVETQSDQTFDTSKVFFLSN